MSQQEIRTQDKNLLMCVMRWTDDNNLVFESKNGKRVDYLSLDNFIEQINEFSKGRLPQLHIG